MNLKYFIPLTLLAGFAAIAYLADDIVTPFIVGFVLAYFSKPLHQKFISIGFAPSLSALTCMLFITLLVITFFATLVPLITQQVSALSTIINEKRPYLNSLLTPHLATLESYLPEIGDQIENFTTNISNTVLTFIRNILSNLLSTSLAAAHFLSLVFITPFAYFYFLRDWAGMSAAVKHLIPQPQQAPMERLWRNLDESMSAYIRGQFFVCILLACYYSLSLFIVGLHYAIAIGFISGFLTFIPYLGATFSAIFVLLMATIQFGVNEQLLYILLIFAVGQFIEGNFLVPRIMGSSLKLHPLWIIFALLAAGAIFGFIGVLIALPLTAALGVVIRFVLNEYKRG